MTARDFLKELPVYSKIFDLSIDYQYTEEQLILFAEMYHKKQVKTLNIDDVSNCLHENQVMRQGDGDVYHQCLDCCELLE